MITTKILRHKDLNFNFKLLRDFVPLWQINTFKKASLISSWRLLFPANGMV